MIPSSHSQFHSLSPETRINWLIHYVSALASVSTCHIAKSKGLSRTRQTEKCSRHRLLASRNAMVGTDPGTGPGTGTGVRAQEGE